MHDFFLMDVYLGWLAASTIPLIACGANILADGCNRALQRCQLAISIYAFKLFNLSRCIYGMLWIEFYVHETISCHTHI
jgi:hypothetical protein